MHLFLYLVSIGIIVVAPAWPAAAFGIVRFIAAPGRPSAIVLFEGLLTGAAARSVLLRFDDLLAGTAAWRLLILVVLFLAATAARPLILVLFVTPAATSRPIVVVVFGFLREELDQANNQAGEGADHGADNRAAQCSLPHRSTSSMFIPGLSRRLVGSFREDIDEQRMAADRLGDGKIHARKLRRQTLTMIAEIFAHVNPGREKTGQQDDAAGAALDTAACP
jgi:hypothetical protein